MEIVKTKFIMGTDIEIIINSKAKEENILEDIQKSFDIFYDLEKEFSRFDKFSTLSLLNKNKTLVVSDRFIEVSKLSIEIHKKTYGFFNPLINISTIGYSHNFGDKNFKKTTTKQNLDISNIQIIGNTVTLQSDQNLDFGGIVKGYTVDGVKKYLQEKGYKDFIINAGGDMYISKKSTIAIDSPENNGDIFALVELENISLSTSGTYKRKWKIENKIFHHILNPQNNKNSNEIVSISLFTKKCYIGDCYATACIAMGLEKSLDFLNKENIDGIIIGKNRQHYKIGDLKKYSFEII